MTVRRCAMTLCLVVAAAVCAQEQERQFESSLAMGVTMTDGNSETLQANASLLAKGERADLGSYRAGLEGNYGESVVNDERERTVQNARALANARKKLTSRAFAVLDGTALHDDVALVDYRLTLGPGLGLYLVKTKETALSLETGPAQVWEKVASETDEYITWRVANRFEQSVGPTAKLWQSAEYLVKADDGADYLVTAEVGAEAAMNSRMNLRVVLQEKHDSTPAPGLERNDVTLIAGFSLSL